VTGVRRVELVINSASSFYSSDQIKKNEMDGECSRYGGD
jgi:hypothetical protein